MTTPHQPVYYYTCLTQSSEKQKTLTEFCTTPSLCSTRKLDMKRYNIERHGPAKTFTGTMDDPRAVPIDSVIAVRSRSWPNFNTEWLHRERANNWPPINMIGLAETLGCLFVPVGHMESQERTLEWRASFSLQERQLMFNMNEVQHKCYVLLKLVKSDIIKAEIDGDSITSYHMKTCLFYCIENTRPDFWHRNNLVRCLIYCLGTLLYWIRQGYCPNYFIKEQNLFKGKLCGRLRERICHLLDKVLSEDCKLLFKIKCDDIGKQLFATFYNETYHSANNIVQNTKRHEAKLQCEPICHWHRCVNALLLHCSKRNDIISCIACHETLISYLYSVKTITEHTESETRTALQYILPFVHTSLACQLVAQVLETTGPRMSAIIANTPIQVLETTGPRMSDIIAKTPILKHLSKGLESDLLSGILKQAAIYNELGDYEKAERILATLANTLSTDVAMICACRVIRNNIYIGTTFHEASAGLSAANVLRRYVACCVRFLTTELAITPTPLQYEMFRNEGMDAVCVDPVVFLHFMQYLVYTRIGDDAKKNAAVRNLKLLMKFSGEIFHHEATMWNMIGWIYRQENDTIAAMECFQKSLAKEPEHNAALWQIGELCLERLL